MKNIPCIQRKHVRSVKHGVQFFSGGVFITGVIDSSQTSILKKEARQRKITSGLCEKKWEIKPFHRRDPITIESNTHGLTICFFLATSCWVAPLRYLTETVLHASQDLAMFWRFRHCEPKHRSKPTILQREPDKGKALSMFWKMLKIKQFNHKGPGLYTIHASCL